MPICYEIDIEFIRSDEGHEGEARRIPYQLPLPEAVSPGQLDEMIPSAYNELIRKITGSDPSRIPYFGQFTGYRIISIYPC